MLITGSDVSRGKPEPEPYLLAAARLGVEPSKCIVVEDAPSGIEAGKRAGMQVIAIAFTYPRQQLEFGPADVLVDRLADLRMRVNDEGKIRVSIRHQ